MELRWRLEQRARLVVLDERYTSKRCSKCAFHDNTYAENRSVLEAGKRGKCRQSEQAAKTNIFGLRWCPNCETLWHRDVNAGRNIRLVFLELIKPPHERPPTFKKRRSA
jgi:transposase